MGSESLARPTLEMISYQGTMIHVMAGVVTLSLHTTVVSMVRLHGFGAMAEFVRPGDRRAFALPVAGYWGVHE